MGFLDNLFNAIFGNDEPENNIDYAGRPANVNELYSPNSGTSPDSKKANSNFEEDQWTKKGGWL